MIFCGTTVAPDAHSGFDVHHDFDGRSGGHLLSNRHRDFLADLHDHGHSHVGCNQAVLREENFAQVKLGSVEET